MSQFQLYFKLGVQHILEFDGFDHVLFVIVLCAVYLLRDWRKVLILVTAFAIGHSITLVLKTFGLLTINGNLVEFLIPVTIAVTALFNIVRPRPSGGHSVQANYLFALFFGLIHGLSFSNALHSLLRRGGSLFEPLVAFNLGLEVGLITVVGVYLLISSVLVGMLGFNRKEWVLVISSVILGMSLMMMVNARFG